jgi:hypothetical protein
VERICQLTTPAPTSTSSTHDALPLLEYVGYLENCTKGKTELIQELTDRARAERANPPTLVWKE